MIDPGINDPRRYDYPSLVMQARADAAMAEERRVAAAEFRATFVGNNEAIRRGLRNNEAAAGAIRNDHLRLARLAELHDQYPVLADAIAALEAGGRVSIEPAPRMQRVSGPLGPTRSRLLNRVLALIGRLRPAVVEVPVLARRAS